MFRRSQYASLVKRRNRLRFSAFRLASRSTGRWLQDSRLLWHCTTAKRTQTLYLDCMTAQKLRPRGIPPGERDHELGWWLAPQVLGARQAERRDNPPTKQPHWRQTRELCNLASHLSLARLIERLYRLPKRRWNQTHRQWRHTPPRQLQGAMENLERLLLSRDPNQKELRWIHRP